MKQFVAVAADRLTLIGSFIINLLFIIINFLLLI